jgi:lipopolysaccharide/colanic/teichoic acid biosynthesis glycosyltransferase
MLPGVPGAATAGKSRILGNPFSNRELWFFQQRRLKMSTSLVLEHDSQMNSPNALLDDSVIGAAAPIARGAAAADLRLVPIAVSDQPGDYVLVPAGNRHRGYQLLKRAGDIAGALVLLILLGPVMLVTYLLLLVTTKGHPIFAQERVGLCGRTFTMYKFRTMRLDADRLQHLVPNEKDGPVFKNRRDPRITRIGRFLRSTSIDETPQIFNVLRGDMALVGPRPPVPQEVEKYQPWQRARLTVKPGLTCLWQVSGRCEIGFDDWTRMDIWYRQHQSLATDLQLLSKTPLSVLSRRGAY